jgi:hypothetical protein
LCKPSGLIVSVAKEDKLRSSKLESDGLWDDHLLPLKTNSQLHKQQQGLKDSLNSTSTPQTDREQKGILYKFVLILRQIVGPVPVRRNKSGKL